MIDITDLVFEYPGHRALDGVSAHIDAGSVTALVGPNGAGKSTLLRCIAALDQPLSGQVRLCGIDVLENPREAHRHIGYLSDFYGLYTRLSAAQCLQYAARSQGLDADEALARTDEVAHQLGLGELLQRRPDELSRGQRQRLAIGQAIIHRPEVLLLDEPASGLDPEARSSLAQLFRQLQAQGMTLVVSSHILSELDEYCTHLLALRGARVENHVPLQTGGAAATPERKLYALELATPVPAQQLAQALQSAQIEQLGDAGQPTLVWLPADANERAAWLSRCIQAGLPVAGLQVHRPSLQSHYIRKEAQA